MMLIHFIQIPINISPFRDETSFSLDNVAQQLSEIFEIDLKVTRNIIIKFIVGMLDMLKIDTLDYHDMGILVKIFISEFIEYKNLSLAPFDLKMSYNEDHISIFLNDNFKVENK